MREELSRRKRERLEKIELGHQTNDFFVIYDGKGIEVMLGK
jgi:hypothetical protein